MNSTELAKYSKWWKKSTQIGSLCWERDFGMTSEKE
jgi:hypothetical protein